MERTYLPFEQPIEELAQKIAALKNSEAAQSSGVDFQSEIQSLENKQLELCKKIFSNLTPWQITQIARHPDRPHTPDYIKLIFTDYQELCGDRAFADDRAIIGGLARFDGKPVMVIGHQKGRKVQEKVKCNFGMPSPEGYRKALRLAKLAEQYRIPLITFIDTAGAYAGVGAEERGQSEAIARNLRELSNLKTPIICNVVGEGGSGGALAIGVGDNVNMLEFSTYSVISPEGCASILWKSADKASTAAETMGLTAPKIKKLGLIDEIIPEPLGGAHSDYQTTAENIAEVLRKQLAALEELETEELLEKRYQRLLSFGDFDIE
ncbi:acetyl-CoA carboxylase carboxyl transferase subunit alpha [Psittacicella melopsittaci]|uniref:Acetyl-coenzyme A carboxylase carboxyl transferase subunit alpha n=1 Tax=Psittacicella melopsittaci TaxID=2028576 RepID=A0A3A1Y2Q3_9GAMM|nr:acetyl-CoA carboxylase carboxyltransferase subunit alpha [Psittacicella melopsittaci]RIY31721.1 acetyl-CoA carboxylase carboxyl transferase subunit alpha [Psittacicella melopsittaci]